MSFFVRIALTILKYVVKYILGNTGFGYDFLNLRPELCAKLSEGQLVKTDNKSSLGGNDSGAVSGAAVVKGVMDLCLRS